VGEGGLIVAIEVRNDFGLQISNIW